MTHDKISTSGKPLERADPAMPAWRATLEVLLILAVFTVHAGWAIPDVNEPHYLAKAKHYWNPAWGQGDFFLETADAHEVFYWSFGWLSLWLPLPTMALVGRAITWMLMAWAWQRLSFAVLPRPWMAVLSAGLFVLLNERAHMAGEWVIGGIEAKGFAYVLVLFGLEAVVRGKWNRVWLFLGAASAFHVLVGGWSAIAAAVVWLASPRDRPTLGSMLLPLAGGLVLACAGLVPALALTMGESAEVVAEGNRIYVYERLPHHLLPGTFKEGFIGRHVLMGFLWLALCTFTAFAPAQRRLQWFTAAAVGVAITGFVLINLVDGLTALASSSGWNAEALQRLETSLLRYYWFRLSDAALPIGTSLAALIAIEQLRVSQPRLGKWWLAATTAVALIYLGGRAWEAPWASIPRVDKNVVYEDWLDVCRWIRDETPADANFITPRLAGTFHWHAGRNEVVAWKNIPQDAAGIVEWWQRIVTIHGKNPTQVQDRWYYSPAEAGSAKVREVAAKYEASHIVIAKDPLVPPLEFKPLYENATYAVYELP